MANTSPQYEYVVSHNIRGAQRDFHRLVRLTFGLVSLLQRAFVRAESVDPGERFLVKVQD